MDDDDTEDVVLVDSPLYLHMKEMGFEEFETAAKCDISLEDSAGKEIPMGKIPQEYSYVKNFVKKTCKLFLYRLINLSMKRSQQIRKLIFDSQLLQESDKALLEDLCKEFSSEDEQQGSKGFMLSELFLSDFSSMTLSILSLSYLVAFVTYLEATLWSCVVLVAFSLCLIIVLFLWLFLRLWKSRYVLLRKKTTELLNCAYNLQNLFKKGIRMIQEAELIARGFTLISVQATAQRLESSVTLPVRSPEKQCPELREAIFQFARTCFFAYRNSTYQLLKIFPLHKDIDMSSHYLACIKLTDLGPLFSSGNTSLSDFFSVSSLKSVIQLMQLQQSEFFRRFGLSFFYGLSSNSNIGSISKVIQAHTEMESILKNVLEPIMSAIIGLQRLQLYYKHLGFQKSEVEYFASKEGAVNSHAASFKVAVHSLLLHLQASIIRVQDLENQILDIPESSEFSEEQSKAFHKMLLEVQSEFDASSVCLEESLLQLTSPKQQPKSEDPGSLKVITEAPKAMKVPIPLFEMGEPAIEDQVFEAFTTHVDDSTNYSGSNDLWVTDDKVRREKSKESSANLLKELKSVLVNKAEEHRRREAIAERKLDGGEKLSQPESNEISSFQLDFQPECTTKLLLESFEKSDATVVDQTQYASGVVCRASKSDSDSTGSIEIINADSPLEEKVIDLLEAEHDSASTGSIEVCGESPLVEQTLDFHTVVRDTSFNLAAAIASQVAQRSRFLGLSQQVFTAEPEETFADSDSESPS